ncbi:MAG: glycosyltransferase [Bacteroidota bacterium]
MKVLMFIDSLRSGGKERRLVELLKGLRQRDTIQIEVAIMSEEITYQDFFTLNIPIYYLLRDKKKDPKIFSRLFSLCKDVKPDIIHVWDSMTAVYAIPVCKLRGIKLINSMITDAPRLKIFSRGWVRSKLSFPFSDMILANSQAGLRSYNAPSGKSNFIHNGFDFNRVKKICEPGEIRAKFHIETEHVVVMVATFSPYKDYESYIMVAKEIVDKRSDVTFLTLGDGPMLQSFSSQLNTKYQSRIKLLGRQSDVESIVSASTIGVLLTNTEEHGEGISNSIMEYMAFQKPVIATDSGGTREIVEDGITGFIIGQRDRGSFRTNLELLLENPAKAREMGLAGRKRIEDEFSLSKMVDSFYHEYEKLCRK